MGQNNTIPINPLEFIQRCVSQGKIFWTYHVNMRLKGRSISRSAIKDSYGHYEIIEQYPQDKYLPSYLVRSEHGDDVLHILFAADVKSDNIRIITAYRPTIEEWEEGFRIRRKIS